MRQRLKRYEPVWRADRYDLKILKLALIFFFITSLCFYPTFLEERKELIRYGSHSFAVGALNLGGGLRMPPFWALARRYLLPIPLSAAVFLCAGVAQNYLSCRKEARSDYTLRRLRDPWEYHRRCLALPVFEALALLLLLALLTGIYYAYYLRMTPPELLPPAGERFWG